MRMDEGNSERYMKRRLTIPGGGGQDNGEHVSGGFFYLSESSKIDSETSQGDFEHDYGGILVDFLKRFRRKLWTWKSRFQVNLLEDAQADSRAFCGEGTHKPDRSSRHNQTKKEK